MSDCSMLSRAGELVEIGRILAHPIRNINIINIGGQKNFKVFSDNLF
jgi:hypothetical protein